MDRLYLGVPWPLVIQQSSSQALLRKAKPSFLFFPATEKQTFFLFLRMRNAPRKVTQIGVTIKRKHLDLNFPSYCPFRWSLKYFTGLDTGLILLPIVAGSQKHTKGLCRRVCNSKNSFRKGEKNVTWNQTERNGLSSNFPAQLWELSYSQVSPGFS